jgi:hypothetical protein
MLKLILFYLEREADMMPYVHKCCSQHGSKDCSSWRNCMNWASRQALVQSSLLPGFVFIGKLCDL